MYYTSSRKIQEIQYKKNPFDILKLCRKDFKLLNMRTKFAILFFLVGVYAQAQNIIKGKIVDEFNNPMPFVNVFLQGTKNGATTDDDGRFAFTSSRKRGNLEVSFVGFKTKIVKISPKTKFYTITLEEGSDELDEIIVVSRPKKRLKKKENPAYRILKEVWKRKRKNGLKLVDHYQFKRHTSIEVGINNLDSIFLKKLFKEQYKKTLSEIKYDSDGVNYYIPVYMQEEIAKVYGNNKINKEKTNVEAEKSNGLGADGFVFNRMALAFSDVDIFKNNIEIMQKSFVSPISTDGFATYDYVLYDSIVDNGKKLYNIYFFPIRDEDLAFHGNLFVADKNFSVKKIKMKVTKNANLNFVRGLTFEKEYAIKNDSIYTPITNSYEGDFTFIDKSDDNKGLTIKKTESIQDYIFNVPKPNDFYYQKIEKIRPDQFKKDDSYWKENKITENEQTYNLINSVKSKRKIKKLTGLINTVASGYVNITKNLQVGPLWTSFAFNEVEGFRTKLGIRSFVTKDDRFRINGFIAYAFKDKKIKYGAEARYLLSYKPRISVGLAHQKSVQQLGSVLLNTTQLLGRSFGTTALFSRGENYFLSNVNKTATNFDYKLHDDIHFGLNLTYSEIKSAAPQDKFSTNFINGSQINQGLLKNFASDLYISYTPGRIVYGYGVEQSFGKNLYPSIVLNYQHGYKGAFESDFDYGKLQIKYNQPILLDKFGLLDATVEVGKTFNKVPIALLSPIPANQSYSLVKNTFSLLNYYDFITDTYITGHFEHHFNGFILNRIPLLRKLKLRSLVTFRGAYGSVSDENIKINRSNISYNAPEKLYYEYGFGIENIGYGNLRFLRVDAIWRSEYQPLQNTSAVPTPKFALRIGINPGL